MKKNFDLQVDTYIKFKDTILELYKLFDGSIIYIEIHPYRDNRSEKMELFLDKYIFETPDKIKIFLFENGQGELLSQISLISVDVNEATRGHIQSIKKVLVSKSFKIVV